jgi:hypothetical protein
MELQIGDLLIVSPVLSVISLICLLIFLKGQAKQADSQILYSLVAISLKFLLEIIFALLWFIVAKKTALPSVLMFFVLYLAHTLFTIWVIIRTLKNKGL